MQHRTPPLKRSFLSKMKINLYEKPKEWCKKHPYITRFSVQTLLALTLQRFTSELLRAFDNKPSSKTNDVTTPAFSTKQAPVESSQPLQSTIDCLERPSMKYTKDKWTRSEGLLKLPPNRHASQSRLDAASSKGIEVPDNHTYREGTTCHRHLKDE